MEKAIPLLVIGIMLLSGIGVVAVDNNIQHTYPAVSANEESNGGSRSYTHTVLVEVGTSTTCPSCPASNSAWHSIYAGGNYDFEYCGYCRNHGWYFYCLHEIQKMDTIQMCDIRRGWF